MNLSKSFETLAIRPQEQIQGVDKEDDDEPGDLLAEEVDRGEAKTKIKKMLDPKLPSQADIDFHMLTHLPYRNWCEHCVKGRAKEMSHEKSTEKRETVEFHMDFCFPGEEDGSGGLTILVIRERQTRMTMASAVPSKSMGEFHSKERSGFHEGAGVHERHHYS